MQDSPGLTYFKNIGLMGREYPEFEEERMEV